MIMQKSFHGKIIIRDSNYPKLEISSWTMFININDDKNQLPTLKTGFFIIFAFYQNIIIIII